MSKRVVVERLLESADDIKWDNSILKLPSILSSPCKFLLKLLLTVTSNLFLI